MNKKYLLLLIIPIMTYVVFSLNVPLTAGGKDDNPKIDCISAFESHPTNSQSSKLDCDYPLGEGNPPQGRVGIPFNNTFGTDRFFILNIGGKQFKNYSQVVFYKKNSSILCPLDGEGEVYLFTVGDAGHINNFIIKKEVYESDLISFIGNEYWGEYKVVVYNPQTDDNDAACSNAVDFSITAPLKYNMTWIETSPLEYEIETEKMIPPPP